uniref:Kinesin motor domain-containing protein n=1 Tax=Gongylonema pulchrum TaxID=637853 RepID=A0A183D3N6_9BILA
LKGISLLSLEFGTLSEENLALKNALVNAQRSIHMLQLRLNIDPSLTDSEVPQNAEKMCQTEDAEQPALNLELGASGQIRAQDEENNNIRKRYDQETAAALQKNMYQLIEAKIELKKLAADIRDVAHKELRCIRKSFETKVSCYVGSLVQRYLREVDARKRLHNKLVELSGNIRVFCRIRPAASESSEKLCVHIDPFDNSLITVDMANGERKKFNCDRAFSEKHTQADVNLLFC